MLKTVIICSWQGKISYNLISAFVFRDVNNQSHLVKLKPDMKFEQGKIKTKKRHHKDTPEERFEKKYFPKNAKKHGVRVMLE